MSFKTFVQRLAEQHDFQPHATEEFELAAVADLGREDAFVDGFIDEDDESSEKGDKGRHDDKDMTPDELLAHAAEIISAKSARDLVADLGDEDLAEDYDEAVDIIKQVSAKITAKVGAVEESNQDHSRPSAEEMADFLEDIKPKLHAVTDHPRLKGEPRIRNDKVAISFTAKDGDTVSMVIHPDGNVAAFSAEQDRFVTVQQRGTVESAVALINKMAKLVDKDGDAYRLEEFLEDH